MGKIIKQYELEESLCLFTVLGQVTSEDILHRIKVPSIRDLDKIVLWDFTEGNMSFYPNRGLPSRENYFPRNQKNERTALVCPKELDYGLAKILKVFSEVYHFPLEIRVFRNMKAASRWLGVCKLCFEQQLKSKVSNLPCLQNCSRYKS